MPSAMVLHTYLGLAESSRQNIDRVCLVEQFGFESQAGREPKVGVRRARKAVDAAMAASAVRVDGHVETHLGRIVRGDDALRAIRQYGLGRVFENFFLVPAVVCLFENQ